MPEAAEWSFTDAWLLTSVGGYGRRGCTLTNLIGTADARNHDVATEAQSATSLGRLIASDLLVVKNGRFRVTDTGQSLYKQRSGGWFEESGSVLQLLSAIPLVEGTWEFAPGEYMAAYEVYSSRMR